MVANPDQTFIVKMKSGNVFLGDTQFLPGYCLLFAEPKVSSLNDLKANERACFTRDMALLGDAIMNVLKPIRVNYAILCNSHPFLHAHIFPRYDWEDNNLKTKNVWQYPENYWQAEEYKFNLKEHSNLMTEIRDALIKLMDESYSVEK